MASIHAPQQHPIDRAAAVVGSQVVLASILNVTKAAVGQWKLPDRQVPIEHCPAIERATDKTVMRWDLRPHDWHLIWPELIGSKGAPKVKLARAA